MRTVRWTLNYDLREFDSVWAWLHTLPDSPERACAIGAAGLIAVAELDRPELRTETLAAFDAAIPAFPDDARLPLWRAYVRFLAARDANDGAALNATLQELRDTSVEYPTFTPFGVTLAIGGYADASPELLDEASRAFETVVTDSQRMQLETHPLDRVRARRIWDSPIAPFNIPAMQAMIGDLALRRGDKDAAARAYYTAINSNFAARWPWRAEVERRLMNMPGVQSQFAEKKQYALGSQGVGAMGVDTVQRDARFGGRIGNGSCTVCHTHVSLFDEDPNTTLGVGWIRGRYRPIEGVKNAMPVVFALPDGKDPRPAGFGIGPFVESTAGDDYDRREELFTGEFYVPAAPGRWFIALQTSANGVAYQGYGAQGLGAQWFVDVKAGEVSDLSSAPITLTRQ